ncbi:MAG TPA: alpha/beta fold hydrolase [Candidatus Acidoferrum sp.]
MRILFILAFTPPIVAAGIGWLAGPSFLHPLRRELSPDLIKEADSAFLQMGTHPEEFDVRPADGVLLRGWKVRAVKPTANWVLVFHGVADNRVGVVGQAQLLLQAGYSVVMMDARAHGASDGPMATYGWLERNDTRAVVDALEATEHPHHLFALGESMGAGIALQSAAVEPRIEAVVAEASFASLREAAYDYAGLQRYPLLGMTLLAPGAWTMVYHGELAAGFPAGEVSPEKAVAARPFPVLLICDAEDTVLPCRHTKRIYAAARGLKQMWVVPHAFHTAALGYEPAEFRRRVLEFFATYGGN